MRIKNAAKSRQQYMMLYNYRETTFNPKLDKALYAVVSTDEPIRMLEHRSAGDKPVSAPVVFSSEAAAMDYIQTGNIPGTPVPAVECDLMVAGETIFHVTQRHDI